MGPVERKLTAITTVVVFAAGIWVVIFAPFKVNDDGNNQFHIIDYSFTKGINEAATLAKSHCAERGLVASGLDTQQTYNRTQKTFGTRYRFSCQPEE